MPNREYVQIRASSEYIAEGWPAFQLVDKALRQLRRSSDEIEWRYSASMYGIRVATFEVVK